MMVTLDSLAGEAGALVADGQDASDAAAEVVWDLSWTEVFGLLAHDYTALGTNALDPWEHKPDTLLEAARWSVTVEIATRLAGFKGS